MYKTYFANNQHYILDIPFRFIPEHVKDECSVDREYFEDGFLIDYLALGAGKLNEARLIV